MAIGASRTRLLRHFLAESLLPAILGGGSGLALAFVSVDTLNLLSQRMLPRAEDIRIDQTVLMFTFALATLTGILFGLAPAVQRSAVDLHEGLKESGGVAESGSRHPLRAALVIAEVALALVLLVGAGLMVKSVYRLLNVEAGFDAQRVLTMQINLPAQKYVETPLVLDDFGVLRRSNLRLLTGASDDDLKRVGVHAERGEESVEHMIGLYAGHDLLHLRQLDRIRRAVGFGFGRLFDNRHREGEDDRKH